MSEVPLYKTSQARSVLPRGGPVKTEAGPSRTGPSHPSSGDGVRFDPTEFLRRS